MKRPLFWMGIVFLSATAVFLCAPSPVLSALGCALVFGIAFLLSGCTRREAAVLFALVLFSAGSLFFHIRMQRLYLSPLAGQRVTGTLAVSESEIRSSKTILTGTARLKSETGERSFPVRLTVWGGCSAKAGDAFSFSASVNPHDDAFSTPGEPLSLSASALSEEETAPDAPRLSLSLAYLRAKLSQAVVSMLPDQEEAGILCAVLVGDRSLLTEDTVQNFRRAGLSHLLVVSGMHLCLAAALAKALFSRFSERKRCLSVCLFVWCCAVLTGFGVSVVRAAIMVTSAESAVLFRRRGDTPTALSLAGILIVLVSPGAVTSASFLLSFSSVLGIALFSDRIGNALVSLFHPGKRLRRALFSSLAVSAAAQFGTLPVLAVCFGTVPALGLFANLFAVPLLAPILLFGALGILLFPLRAVFGLLCGVMLRILCAIASLFSLVPFSQFGISERWQLVWIAFAFLLCARCARSASQHRRRVSFLSGTLLLLVCTLFSFDAAQSAVTVTVFPQENMALLSRGTRAVLLGVPADSYAAKKVISAMQRQNLFTLESIICAEQTLPSALFTVTEQFSPAGIAAPDTPANRALCHAAGLRLCETDHLLALGSFPVSLEEPGLLAVIDPDGERLCPSDGICVIIEETFCTPYPLPDAVRIRRPIRRTP